MLAASRTTHQQLYVDLADGNGATLTARMLEDLVIGKAAQQLTNYNITDIVRKFDIAITAAQPNVVATMQIGVIDALYARIPPGVVRTRSDTLFKTLIPYATADLEGVAYTACVRFKVYPTTGFNSILYDQALSTVEVGHDININPPLSFSMKSLADEYNGIIWNLANDALPGLKYFTGGGANPALYKLNEILGELAATRTLFDNINTAYPPPADIVSTGQSIPVGQRLDYYFPLLINGASFVDGAINLTP